MVAKHELAVLQSAEVLDNDQLVAIVDAKCVVIASRNHCFDSHNV